MRTLVAGFGNVLRGDDGFGVEVVRRLTEDASLGHGVDLLDVGTGGIRLVQALSDGYDRLVIVDAVARGSQPGTLFTLAVDAIPHDSDVDMHLAVPAKVLSMAAAMNTLPREVFIVGCEPAETEELALELSPAVSAAVDGALARIRTLAGRPGPA